MLDALLGRYEERLRHEETCSGMICEIVAGSGFARYKPPLRSYDFFPRLRPSDAIAAHEQTPDEMSRLMELAFGF